MVIVVGVDRGIGLDTEDVADENAVIIGRETAEFSLIFGRPIFFLILFATNVYAFATRQMIQSHNVDRSWTERSGMNGSTSRIVLSNFFFL